MSQGSDFEVHVLCGSTNFHITMCDEFDKWEAMRRAVDRVALDYHIDASICIVLGCKEITQTTEEKT